MKLTTAWWLCVFGMATIGMVACTSLSGSASGSIEAGNVKATGTITVGQPGTYNAHSDEPKAMRVGWYDKDGNKTGEAVIPPGRSAGTIPEGSVRWQYIGPAPIPASSSTGGTGGMAELVQADDAVADFGTEVQSGNQHAPRSRAPFAFTVVGGPLCFNLTSAEDNAVFEFRVRAATEDEASELVNRALTQAMDEPLDERIEIVSWLKAVPTLDGGSVVALSRDFFTEFTLDVNDLDAYGDLGAGRNATQTRQDNGLWTVTSHVDADDIQGYEEWNRIAVDHLHGGLSSVETVRLSMIHQQ